MFLTGALGIKHQVFQVSIPHFINKITENRSFHCSTLKELSPNVMRLCRVSNPPRTGFHQAVA